MQLRSLHFVPSASPFVLLVCAACGGGGATPPTAKPAVPVAPAATPPPAPVDEAGQLFATVCATCHGTTGHGDGPGAVALNPKPRTFADATWQDSVTDAHIKKVVVEGGAAVGKSPLMVGQPQLAGNDKVLDGLVKIVRGFRGK